MLTEAVKGKGADSSYFQQHIKDILQLKNSFEDCLFCLFPKEVDRVAHASVDHGKSLDKGMI